MKKKTGLLLLLVLALVSGAMSGCSFFGNKIVLTTNITGATVLKINDESVSVEEAKVFLYNYRNCYENVYGRGLFKTIGGKNSLESYTKKTTLNVLAKMKTMVLLAKKKKISLSKEEEQKIHAAAQEYYKSLSKEDKSVLSVSRDTIEGLYTDMVIATKLYTQLTGGIDGEVSDEAARVMLVKQIVVSDAQTAKTVKKKLKDGVSFENLQNVYSNEASDVVALYRQKMSETTASVLIRLNDDEISHCIQENGKYYYYKIVSKIDRELTNENKNVIRKLWAKDAFDSVYQKFCNGLASNYNESAWKDISLEEGENCRTDSFFAVFEEHLGYLKQD